jgi:CHASE3 domain sensor protein
MRRQPDQVPIKSWLVGLVSRDGLNSLAVEIFAITSVLMIAALILMSFSLSSLKASHVQSEATEDTLLEVTTVEARLLDTDRMLNGYAVSGEGWYLVRAEKAKKEMFKAMDKLGRSIRGDAKLVGEYKTVATTIAKRQAAYDYLFQPQHRGEIANFARSTAALAERNLTDEVRHTLWDLLRAERAKRFARHVYMIHEAQKSFWIAVGVMVLSIVSGVINLLLMHYASAKYGSTAADADIDRH